MAIHIITTDWQADVCIGKNKKTIEAKDVTLRGQFGHFNYEHYNAERESGKRFIDKGYVWRESLEYLRKAHNLDDLNLFAKEVKRTRAYVRIGIFLDKECSSEEPEFEFRVKRENTFKGIKKLVAITDAPSQFSFTIQTR
jgi:hypothetical protein